MSKVTVHLVFLFIQGPKAVIAGKIDPDPKQLHEPTFAASRSQSRDQGFWGFKLRRSDHQPTRRLNRASLIHTACPASEGLEKFAHGLTRAWSVL
jgi:hypothetical protein